MRDRSVWGPPAVALGCPVVLLLPWWLPALLTGAGAGLALDAGRLPMAAVDFADLVTGHLGDAGAPAWLGLMLLGVAVLALVPAATRIPVIVCWIVAFAASLVALGLGLVTFEADAVTTRAGLGFLVLVIQAGFVVAAVVAAQGALHRFREGWWHRAVVVVVAAAAVVPLVGLGWFVVNGPGDLEDDTETGIPAYMMQSSELSPSHGILVIEGDVDSGLTWSVQRDDGLTLGEDEVVGLMASDRTLDADVRTLVSAPEQDLAQALPGHGIEYVVLPAPADGNVAAVLDATDGLEQASAEDRATRAWRVAEPVDETAVTSERPWWRRGLVGLQVLAIVVVAVLCVPTQRREGRA
jgi:hypothetical protein